MKTIQMPKVSSTVQHRYYCKDSLIHPAKMSPILCQWMDCTPFSGHTVKQVLIHNNCGEVQDFEEEEIFKRVQIAGFAGAAVW